MPRRFFEIHQPRGNEFYALSPVEQQGVYDLERYEGGNKTHNVKLLLAALLVPKFSSIEIFNHSLEKRQEEERQFEQILARFHLQFIKKESGDTALYIVGKEAIPAVAQKYLSRIPETPLDLESYHREYGELMGIPATAINAFIQKNTFLSSAAVPFSQEVKKFKWFGISKDAWQEESKQVEAFSHKVKSISPALYDSILNDL